MIGPLSERLDAVRAEVDAAIRQSGRDAGGVTMIVVTKQHSDSLVRELADYGVVDFGENRHQEAKAKSDRLSDLVVTWHFVGQLQSKKARAVAAYARVIHSVDRDSVVDALGASGFPTDVFIQLNLTADPSRGGLAATELELMTERVVALPRLRLLGVMAVAPLDEEPRRAFARLRRASDRVRAIAPDATGISAGMSADYRDAILEGATHLRIGSAITGNRPGPG